VCSYRYYLLQYIYLTNSPIVKASAKNVHIRYKRKLTDTTPFSGASFINDCLLQPMLHVNNQLLQFADIMLTNLLLSTGAFFPDFIVTGFKPELLRQPYYLAR